MQVVSGPLGKQHLHYEAPPAEKVDAEMRAFLDSFSQKPRMDGRLRSALAHLWFVTIHPFDDGNGRIARAIADQALAQSEATAQRFYSMSSQIRRERSAYHDALEHTQKGNLEITEWLLWFVACFSRALEGAEATSAHVLRKADFRAQCAHERFNQRQKLVLNRYLDGFEGKLTAKKWAALSKASIPTAQRDINDLVERGILRRNAGGSKNTSYEVVINQ